MSDEQDDAARRAELVRKGLAPLARLGAARLGAMRLNVTLDTLVQRLIIDVADLRTRLDRVEAEQQQLRPKRQKGQNTAATNKRTADIALYKRVETRRRKTTLEPRAAMHSDLRSRKEPVAVRREGKKILLPFLDLTPDEQTRKLDAEMKKYYRGKSSQAKAEAGR